MKTCAYCNKELISLKEGFYCPPSYELKEFCPTTKTTCCHKDWSDSRYFVMDKVEELKKEIGKLTLDISLDDLSFDFTYHLSAIDRKIISPKIVVAYIKYKLLEKIEALVEPELLKRLDLIKK